MKLFLAVVVGFVFAVEGIASELRVPEQHLRIQSAIDAASTGDVVVIAPGAYAETLTLKNGVSLRGASREGVIVEAPSTAGAVLTIDGCIEGTVESMTFRFSSIRETPDGKESPAVIEVLDSSATVTDCAITGGEWNGVLIEGGNTPTLTKSKIAGHKGNGIYVRGDTISGVVQHNEMLNNGLSGIVVHGEDTRVLISRNVMKGNGAHGLHAEGRTNLRAEKNDFVENALLSETECNLLVNTQEYDNIERIAERLRREKLRYPSGSWQLNALYHYMADSASGLGKEGLQRTEKFVADWKAAYPDSITWRLYMSDVYQQLAWDARGSGTVDTVTDEGWKVFQTNLEKARVLLDNVDASKVKDPHYFKSRFKIESLAPVQKPQSLIGYALETIADLLGAEEEDTAKPYFDLGVTLEPEYLPLYEERVRTLLPRWGGSNTKMMSFAEESADRFGGRDGDALYALIAYKVYQWEGSEFFREYYSFSWDRIIRGYGAFLEKFPGATRRRYELIWLASIHGDREIAGAQFKTLPAERDPELWPMEHEYNAYRAWALEGAPFPKDDPLQTALYEGDIDAVKASLDAGTDPNTMLPAGMPMFAAAVYGGNFDLAKLLLEKGADVNARNERGEPLLRYMLSDQTTDRMRFLLENGADPNALDSYNIHLLRYCISGDFSIHLPILFEFGADPNTPGQAETALQSAARLGLRHYATIMLDHKADPNLTGNRVANPPVRIASKNRDLNMCKLLLERGADPNKGNEENWTPLYDAADLGDLEMAKLFVAHGADPMIPQTDGWTTFHMATMAGHLELLDYLLSLAPEGINAVTHEHFALLHTAAKNGQTKFIPYLTSKGLDINMRKKDDNKTPLTIALENNRAETAQAIREAGGVE